MLNRREVAAGLASMAVGAFRGSAARLLIHDVTLIDGRGGPPTPAMSLIIVGDKIEAVRPSLGLTPMEHDRVIDGRGRFVIPGLVDCNARLSLMTDEETTAALLPRHREFILETAQLFLKRGVTTVRDSYGTLAPSIEVRTAIESRRVMGPRMLLAGNIIGWGGKESLSFRLGLPPRATAIDDALVGDVGEPLASMTQSQVQDVIGRYIASGPNFLKIGVTLHTSPWLTFTPHVLRAIIRLAASHTLPVDAHATGIEAKILAAESGVNVIQHVDSEAPYRSSPLNDECLNALESYGVISTINGVDLTDRSLARGQASTRSGSSVARVLARRDRVRQLLRHGLPISLASDAPNPPPAALRDSPVASDMEPGACTLAALEGLVDSGLSPMQAIVSATQVGARACGMAVHIGTLEAGKTADMLLLRSNPLSDISNVRDLEIVIIRGIAIQPGSLPTTSVRGAT